MSTDRIRLFDRFAKPTNASVSSFRSPPTQKYKRNKITDTVIGCSVKPNKISDTAVIAPVSACSSYPLAPTQLFAFQLYTINRNCGFQVITFHLALKDLNHMKHKHAGYFESRQNKLNEPILADWLVSAN